MRTILIGDIHGCFSELEALLQKVSFDIDRDEIVFLGDYTDRGPDSFLVAMKLMGLKRYMKDRCALVMGNHEEMLLYHFNTYWMHKRNGGPETLRSFQESEYDINLYKRFIHDDTVLFYQCNKFNACHAGTYRSDIDNESRETLLWDNYMLKQTLYSGKLTFVGHTPVKNPVRSVLHPTEGDEHGNDGFIVYKYHRYYDIPENGLIAIDTGCVFNGKLTAAVIDYEKNKMIFESIKRK